MSFYDEPFSILFIIALVLNTLVFHSFEISLVIVVESLLFLVVLNFISQVRRYQVQSMMVVSYSTSFIKGYSPTK